MKELPDLAPQPGPVNYTARFVRYGLSTIAALYLWFFCSPYKVHYGPSGYQYYNDDGIFFGLLLSLLLLLVHGGRAFGMGVLYRQKPSALALVFLTFYFGMVCYWLYHMNSNGAQHEN
jgi:hypothetical protein